MTPLLLDHPAMLTDLYQLTMMQGYWAHGRLKDQAAFELFFRRVPEEGGYCIAAGIEDALANVLAARFTEEHLAYLKSLELFRPEFLAFLRTLRFTGSIRAVAEGTPVFPHEPIVEVVGPLAEVQWIETLLLNLINFQTLVATKASRIVHEAAPATVMEFGARRAQGPNGALCASKSAFVGGCVGTSNVEAGLRFGVPVYGTHAHSWIMSFPTEDAAFRAYGETFPDKSWLLIDTYDTLRQGLPNAIAEAKRLEAAGHRLLGIRLDSGDLAWLAKGCRRELDAAGLGYVKILASSDIDQYLIRDLKAQQAPIDVFGVGTRLATSYQEPALGGVYKLSAIDSGAGWQPKVKLSSNPAKTTIPGRKQIWRWIAGGEFLGDCLAPAGGPAPAHMRHPTVDYRQTDLPPEQLVPLLAERIRKGEPVGKPQSCLDARARAAAQVAALPAEHLRLSNPHVYRVGLSDALWQLRTDLIHAASSPSSRDAPPAAR